MCGGNFSSVGKKPKMVSNFMLATYFKSINNHLKNKIMSEFKGTKGNWKARITKYNVDVIVDDDSAFGIIDFGTKKELESQEYPFDEAIANAKLMAAAPELLELVLIMKSDFTGLHYQRRLTENGEKTYQKIIEVIKKATE